MLNNVQTEALKLIVSHGEDGIPWDQVSMIVAESLEEIGLVEWCGTTWSATLKGIKVDKGEKE